MKIKGIPVWLGSSTILVISAVVYFLTGFEQALAALIFFIPLYFLPWDNGVAAGNAETAKVDAYREEWSARRKAAPKERPSNHPTE